MKNKCFLVVEHHKDEFTLEDDPYYEKVFMDKDKANEYVKAHAKFLIQQQQHNQIDNYTIDEVEFNG